MSTPILIVKNQSPEIKQVTFLVDINYTNAFCEHLGNNRIKYRRADTAISEYGYDRNKEMWEFIANEVVAEIGTNDFINLLNGWQIPSTGY